MTSASFPPSRSTLHRFTGLGSVIDEVHGLFAHWQEAGTFEPPLNGFMLEVVKLAVHEWIANLVQHAQFGDTAPEIALSLWPGDTRLRCTIEDNSRGFDLQHQLTLQALHVSGEQPPDRGRGLLMVMACTHDLSYATTPEGRQRLEFWIDSTDDDLCMTVPF
ncbi:MAG: ATP-binding protein [Bacteroidota bacterium]